MKLLTMMTLFGAVISINASADCLVELTGINVNPFIGQECREAMRECSKFKRTNNYSNLQCEIIDENFTPRYDQNGGGYNPPRNTNSTDIIQDFIRGYSANCSVVPFVDGRYHQVYVRGMFKGNYDIRNQYELGDLRRVLNGYVAQGQCRLSHIPTQYNQHGQHSNQVMRFEQLLQRYSSNYYRNCKVIKDSFSNYHQLYVSGQFRGNFRVKYPDERARLEFSLRNYDRDGTCRR